MRTRWIIALALLLLTLPGMALAAEAPDGGRAAWAAEGAAGAAPGDGGGGASDMDGAAPADADEGRVTYVIGGALLLAAVLYMQRRRAI